MEETYGYYRGPERRTRVVRPPDISAISVGVLATIGLTMLLMAFGAALEVNVPAAAAGGAISTEFGTWAVFSAVIGTTLGCMVGGLLCARHTVSSAIGHGLAAATGAIVLGALLGALGIPGLLGSTMTFAATDIGSPAAAASIGWGGWAAFVGLAASLLVGVLGWMGGLAVRPRAERELRIEEHHFVRPVRTVPQSEEVAAHRLS